MCGASCYLESIQQKCSICLSLSVANCYTHTKSQIYILRPVMKLFRNDSSRHFIKIDQDFEIYRCKAA